MPVILDTKTDQKIEQAVIYTLAFFSLYELPMSARRVWELLLRTKASEEEVSQALSNLASSGKIIQNGSLYSTKPWTAAYNQNQIELTKKWARIDKYFNWLAVIPFIRNISVINSLALGTADSDSDIDFFVITKPHRLYFVRSIIIVLFRLLGVYKTRQKIKDRFCFGFYVDADNLKFEQLMIKPADPYFMFWLAAMRPVLGGQQYWQFCQNNQWLTEAFPNLEPVTRLVSTKKPNFIIQTTKILLEILLWLPSLILEPILAQIHINHTFKLAENNTITSSTIATSGMLKLHGVDVRKQIANQFEEILKN